MENEIKHNILEKINNGEITMRPRSYFALKVLALSFVATVVLIFSVFICSFIFFNLRFTAHPLLVEFGLKGLFLFFLLLPWKLIFADVLLIIFLESLIRRFKFGYKIPLLYTLGGITVLTLLFSFVVDRTTDLHNSLLNKADRHELPFGEGFYEDIRKAPGDDRICRCVVTQVGTSSIVVVEDSSLNMHDQNEMGAGQFFMDEQLIQIATSTIGGSISDILSQIMIGDKVLVFGDYSDNRFVPIGVRFIK